VTALCAPVLRFAPRAARINASRRLRMVASAKAAAELANAEIIVPVNFRHGIGASNQEATMGLFSKDIKSLEDLYKHGLQDLYYAENQILKALPKLIENAANAQLKQGLQQHLGETEGQVKRLEQVFKLHEEEPKGTKCPAIDGIIKEGDDLMGEIEGEEVMSVGIVAAAQAVEHYEITRYGALIAWAKELGHPQDAAILARSLDEEKAADRKLTAIAERRVNPQADRGKPGKTAGRSRKGAPAGRKGAAKQPARRTAASSRKAARKTQRSRKSGRA
jgi:ferritin-like metal-binding protein YciE